MKNTITLAVAALVCGTLFSSCKKEDSKPSNGCEISVTGLAGNYKLTGLQYRESAAKTPIDYLPFQDECEKDDLLTLKSDGTYNYKDLGIQCDPDGNDTGSWEIKNGNLVIDGIVHGTITAYDCKTLTFYIENTLVKGDRMTTIMTKQ
ncbi:Lipocalin-like domain-containing protein [Chitinophaga jiangningensis]|uniref:Lipocalin-like domain-containing protein n=1 Tax=Chitinophaga jiangningensis TaxID=1419482 RepID=A0A1M7CLT7_9BACT|nr:lipocalin family protein [Chitinophaga jiangningensis]SHL68248.1 Lipocalin-like domain-containing protein [Chitinophaga jiangningensis]